MAMVEVGASKLVILAILERQRQFENLCPEWKNLMLLEGYPEGCMIFQKKHSIIGILPPDIYEAAIAIARKYSLKIQPSGSFAANQLGLTEQVPAKVVFLTDGKSKTIKIGNTEIIFKNAVPKSMELAGSNAGLLVQALKYLGKKNVDQLMFANAWSKLNQEDKNRLILGKTMAPIWIQDYINKFSQEENIGKLYKTG